ncbi:hypothetical protein [Azospirillum sp. B2RO_4]|uniref:hypothetical protein n=1 Tax=Azospirillum sp. B2RO_4 TaxID=3027796 RepID=UPI003DA867AF
MIDRAVPQSIALLSIMAFVLTGEAQAEVVTMGGDMVVEALKFRSEQVRDWNVTTTYSSWLYYVTFPFFALIYAVRKWYGENWTRWLIVRNLIDDLEETIIVTFWKVIRWKLIALIALSAYLIIKLLLG